MKEKLKLRKGKCCLREMTTVDSSQGQTNNRGTLQIIV